MTRKIEIGKFARTIFWDEADEVERHENGCGYFEALEPEVLESLVIFGRKFGELEAADRFNFTYRAGEPSSSNANQIPFGKLCLVVDKFVGNNHIWYKVLFDEKYTWLPETNLVPMSVSQ